MTTILPPPKSRDRGLPPQRNEIKNNLGKPDPESGVALNFRVPAQFKKDFKIAAATHGITQSDLLKQAFYLWNQNRG